MNGLEHIMAQARTVIEVMDQSHSPWVPVKLTDKQKRFVDSEADETLYGGAAGGGKTVAMLAAAAKHVEHKQYSAVVFRRTFPQLNQPHGILDMAHEWWSQNPDVQWVAADNKFIFPSGATIKFSHLKDERDKYSHQGAEYHSTFWDELTQFFESQYTYLKTRRRKNVGDPLPLTTKATTNPGGIGHKWVKKRFITHPKPGHIFIPATMDDNPYLDKETYINSFDTLDKATKDQLRDGLWIDNGGGLVYPVSESMVIDGFITTATTCSLLAVDLGASESKPSTSFVIISWDEHVPHTVWVRHAEKQAGMTPFTIAERIKTLMASFQCTRAVVDAGALGVGYVKDFRMRHDLPVFAAEKKDKLGNRRLLRGAMESGHVMFVRSGVQPLLDELEDLQWNDAGTDVAKGSTDHAADAFLYGYRDAMAWMSATPIPGPTVGSPEWHKAREDEIMEHELSQSRAQLEDQGYGY